MLSIVLAMQSVQVDGRDSKTQDMALRRSESALRDNWRPGVQHRMQSSLFFRLQQGAKSSKHRKHYTLFSLYGRRYNSTVVNTLSQPQFSNSCRP